MVPQIAAHHLHEVRGEAVPAARAEPDGLFPGCLRLVRRKEVLGDHSFQHDVPPLFGRLETPERVEAGGVGSDADQHGRLSDGEVRTALAQIELGRRLDAMVSVTEEHLVGVEGEDLLLAVCPFDPEGRDRFLDLSLERFFPVQEQLARHLLRDRARPGDDAAGPGVVPQRPRDADGIETEVTPETLILGRHQGVPKVLGQFLEIQLDAALDGELPDFDSALVIHDGGCAGFVPLELFDQGDVALIRSQQPEHGARDRGCGEQESHHDDAGELAARRRTA